MNHHDSSSSECLPSSLLSASCVEAATAVGYSNSFRMVLFFSSWETLVTLELYQVQVYPRESEMESEGEREWQKGCEEEIISRMKRTETNALLRQRFCCSFFFVRNSGRGGGSEC